MTEMILKVDDRLVRELLVKAPDTVRRRVGQLVEGAAIDVQREMRIAANIAVTGNLRRSVQYSFNATNLQAVIEPTAKYAEDVESGTRPHPVSARPGSSLAQWAKLKGINPYAVAKSIAKKGTKAHPFVAPTYTKMKPKVERDIATGIAQLAQELDHGVSR